MSKRKKKRKGFKLHIGAIFENLDDSLEITGIDEDGVGFTLASKHGLPCYKAYLPFGVIRNVLKTDRYKQLN